MIKVIDVNKLELLEYYESKEKELQLLMILKDDLTPKGLETYNKIGKWLSDNFNRYLELREEVYEG